MTKPDGIPKDAAAPALWGTWEDLLLAFAVNRHGAHAWDSIASELHRRISHPNLSLTPHNCRLKYLDLRRRFVDEAKSDAQDTVPLLEELRKLRVAELRRELQRYDLNIESLEMKMKKMEEDRERSLRGENKKLDLKDDGEKTEANPVSEAAVAGEPAAGDEIEKDQLSVNESNSTDPDAEKLRTSEKESEPDRTAGEEAGHDRTGRTSQEPSELKSEPEHKSLREDSCNGSSNSIEKSDRKAETEPSTGQADLVESEAESDGGREAATKENSDVQSSASRSRKEEGNDKVLRGCTSGDEREHEDQSHAVKDSSTESQPLVGLLQAIREHKFGSLFERLVRTQDSSKYQKLILQHIDLGIIETMLKQGLYSGSTTKFFRDVLLLVNNTLVFFGKNSTESNAATEIRWLISKEISQKQTKSDSSSGKHASLQSLSMTKKEEPEPSCSLMLKPLIVCRKRSSIAAAKASASSEKKKEPQGFLLSEERDAKLQQQSQSSAEEPKITKKRTRDRFSSVSANTKKNGKNQPIKTTATESGKQLGKGASSSQQAEAPKKNQSSSDSKKRGAANFLNRMKQGSSSNNSVLLDALKNTPLTSESSSGKGGSEQKKSENAKRSGEKKGTPTRRNTEAKTIATREKGSPAKRNVGRPPKRGAAAPPPPLASGKRNREEGETEMTPSVKQPKKRARKLKL